MALTEIKAETEWTLNSGYGSGLGSIAAGTVLCVQAICEPGTPGVGDDGTPSALVTWWEGEVVRVISMPVAEFLKRCTPVKKTRGSRAR